MKRPHKIVIYPVDQKIDEDKGLWVRIPSWIVRAYRLNKQILNGGRVKITIRDDFRSIMTYKKEENLKSKYYIANWHKKIQREKRKHI